MRTVLLFFVMLGLFVPAGFAIVLIADEPAGYLVIGFGAIALAGMSYSVIAPNSSYEFGPDGLTLRRGGKLLPVLYTAIVGAKALTEKETEAIIGEYMQPIMAGEAGLNFKVWIKSNRRYSRFVRFCTVPIVQQKTTAGSALNIVGFKAKAAGGFGNPSVWLTSASNPV